MQSSPPSSSPTSPVSGFLGGERDYSELEGDTGPLVYPDGFLYAYSAIQYVTGGRVLPAQILFGVLYIVNLGNMLYIYVKTDVVPWWALVLLCLSKRVHSIFVLQLFNNCLAMLLLHGSVVSFIHQWWHLGLIIFSGAVSIKMNVLLYAPPLLLLMLKAMDISGAISALFGASLVQILLGLPFIMSHPVAYISRAFNLGRVFIHFWSVNFKFIPEPIFVSKAFAISLLVVHLALLGAFAHYRWCKYCDDYVRRKFHWHLMCPITALSILLLVFPHITLSFVENTFSFPPTGATVYWSRALLECVSFQHLLIGLASWSALGNIIWSVVCPI